MSAISSASASTTFGSMPYPTSPASASPESFSSTRGYAYPRSRTRAHFSSSSTFSSAFALSSAMTNPFDDRHMCIRCLNLT